MSNENKRTQIEKLIDKAAESHDSNDAQRFSQAASNAAHAMMTVVSFELELAKLKKA